MRSLRSGALLSVVAPIVVSALALTSLAWGCADARPGDAWAGVVDTLPSGAVHVRNPRTGSWDAASRWAAVPDLRIGSAASGGPDQFGRVGDVEIDGRGRLHVLDVIAREVRVFDAEGTWVRTFGRRGGGPGEIELASSLDRGPDGHLWILDSGNGRFQLHDTAGAPVGTHPFAPQMFRYGDVWGPDGLFYTYVAERGSVFRLRIVRRRLEADELVPVDTLPVPMPWEGEVEPVTFQRDGRAFSMMVPVPFQPTSKRLLVPGRGWWLSHPGERYRLARMDLAGDTVLLAERLYDPVPVTRAQLDRALDDLGGVEMNRDRIPARHPPVQELAGLPDGHLLVRRQVAEETPAYDVFSPNGIFLGTLSWEGLDRFTLLSTTDDALYGVHLDALDVPAVVRIRLER